MANAAWLALSVMAHNLGRAVGQLAGPDLERATAATLRRKMFTMPVASSTAAAACTYDSLPLAMGRRDHHRARPHPRPPAALSNNDPRRDDQDLENAGRPARSACPQPDQVATRGPIAAVTSDAKITGGSGVRR